MINLTGHAVGRPSRRSSPATLSKLVVDGIAF
jgi:hypothetical protein